MKKLLINADGFGFTPGVNKGILKSIEDGVVRSTSVLSNMPFVDETPALVQKFPNISIGIHFNLTVGKPVSSPGEVKSLVNKEGNFWGRDFVRKMLSGQIKTSEMIAELNRQVERLVKLGIRPTHFDGQENKHLYPQFFTSAIKVVQKWNIKMMRTHNRYLFTRSSWRGPQLVQYYLTHPRNFLTHSFSRLLMYYAHRQNMRTCDRLMTPGYLDYHDKKSSLESWVKMVETLPKGVNEIYCHPGYVDEYLPKYTYYVKEREVEVDVLTNYKLKKALEENGIQLISFKEL